MIEVCNLTKRYGAKVAVDDVTFSVRPGIVTGFLGPNGAGKSTTMRAILGLDRPTSGTVLIDGQAYGELAAPITTIGALLDAKAADKKRTARGHLRVIAATVGITDARVQEVLDLVGLTPVADKPLGSFSLGMGQRLGLAAALLGDPAHLILDEPVNGLDPDGIHWIRTMMRRLAAEGRTVLVSSHLMSEMELTADHLVVIGDGRLIADQPMAELLAGSAQGHVSIASPTMRQLLPLLRGPGVTVTTTGTDTLEVVGLTAAQIGSIALANGIVLHELHTASASLEEAYLDLTNAFVGFRGAPTTTLTERGL